MNQPVNNPNVKKTRRIPWGSVGILVSTFSVIILLFLFFATNAYYLKHFEYQNHAQENLVTVQKDMGDIEQQVRQLTEVVNNQDQVINALRQAQTGYHRDEWQIVEAEFLVKLANNKLQLDGSVSQAIILLQEADKQIHNLKDEKLLPLRKALAADIATLQAVPQIDVAGLYMRLSALNSQINQMPLVSKPADDNAKAAAVDEKLSWWRRGLQQSWQALQKIVVVRYHSSSTAALMMPEQQSYLYQNLHAALEKAMWGLLHQQNDVYQTSLAQASAWIKEYFVLDTAITKNMLNNLQQLQQINVHPAIPKATDSLQAFQEYFAAHSENLSRTPATNQ